MTALVASAAVPRAFFRRDRLIETSYKLGLVLRLGSSIATVGIFFFISRVFEGAAGDLARYGGSYFAFVLVGVAVNQYLGESVGGLGASLRESQTTGTLEYLILSPSRLPVILLSSTLWLQAAATMGAGSYLVVGAFLGADFLRADLLATCVALLLTIVGFTGLGLLAGSVVLIVKRGNPVGWAIRGASLVLGGVFYPVDVLPAPLQALGSLLPLTHALEVLRGTVLLGHGIEQLAGPMLALATISLATLVLGLGACAASIRFGRADGSLGQY